MLKWDTPCDESFRGWQVWHEKNNPTIPVFSAVRLDGHRFQVRRPRRFIVAPMSCDL